MNHCKKPGYQWMFIGSLVLLGSNFSWGYSFDKYKDVRFLGIESYRDVQMWNWAENVQFRPEMVFVPTTRDELIKIVKEAQRQAKRITVIGKGHSWNPLMEGSDYLISTIKLNQIWVDSVHDTVTVESGATIDQVDQVIEKQGYVVPCNIVGTTDITYGGIMATGSHGSGQNCPTMSDSIEEIEFVKSDGEVELVSEKTHGVEQMNAARLNLGLFGVMYTIKFKVQKTFNVLVEDKRIPIDNLFNVLPSYLKEKENIEVLWFPFTKKAIIKSWNRTNQAVAPEPVGTRLRLQITKWAIYQGLKSFIQAILEKHERMIPILANIASKNLFPERTYVQNVNDAIHYVNEGVNYPINETEIAVPYDIDDLSNVKKGWDAMVQAVRDHKKEGTYPLNVVVHMRFLASSQATLSPSLHNKHTCYMDYGSYYKTPGWRELVNEIWNTWKTLPGARLHWAKDMRAYDNLDLREMYGPENVDRFLKVRETFDPSGRFANDFMRRLFKLKPMSHEHP